MIIAKNQGGSVRRRVLMALYLSDSTTVGKKDANETPEMEKN